MNDAWLQVLTLLFANFTIIWWFRKESREDWIRCQQSIDGIKQEMREFREIWMAESKDFHERLLKIEMERDKK
jgi:hypothetical protein